MCFFSRPKVDPLDSFLGYLSRVFGELPQLESLDLIDRRGRAVDSAVLLYLPGFIINYYSQGLIREIQKIQNFI